MRTTSSWCVINRTDPPDDLSVRMTVMMWLTESMSMPAAGSSRMASFGFIASTDASSIRWRSPPLKDLSTIRSRYRSGARPTCSSADSGSRPDWPRIRYSRTVIPSKWAGSCHARVIPSCARSCILSGRMFAPSNRTVPAVGTYPLQPISA